eukprot:13050411-Alexandrium_andersonii.AAC.1
MTRQASRRGAVDNFTERPALRDHDRVAARLLPTFPPRGPTPFRSDLEPGEQRARELLHGVLQLL